MRAWLTPNTPGGSSARRVLHVPIEYLSSVNGALELLTDADNWEQYGTETPQQAADTMRAMMEEYYMSEVTTDTFQVHGVLPIEHALQFSAPMVWVIDGSQMHNGYWHVTTPVQGQKLKYNVPANDGQVMSVYLVVEKNTNEAILTLKVDGVSIGTHDLYSATLARNQEVHFANAGISGNGYHTVEIACDTKNASSTNYDMRISEITYRITTP